jgi:hypothetical protein
MGLLARFYRGGLSIATMMNMTWEEIEKWYKIYILQSTEEEVIFELSHDKDGKKKRLPDARKIREIVLNRIQEEKRIHGE